MSGASRKNQSRELKIIRIGKFLLEQYDLNPDSSFSRYRLMRIPGLKTQRAEDFQQSILDPLVKQGVLLEHKYTNPGGEDIYYSLSPIGREKLRKYIQAHQGILGQVL